MPSFDVVSEIDQQELRNAVDQTARELAQRFDFKNTDSSIEQKDLVITLRSVTEDRIRAVKQVFEEKLVKRGLSLKGIEWGKLEEASGGTARQVVTMKAGISSDKAREINRLIKEKGPKGVSSQTMGEQVRVTDGPFAEVKEVLGGYWMIDVASRDEAIAWATRCPAGPNEVIEIRQVQEASDFPSEVQAELAGFEDMTRKGRG